MTLKQQHVPINNLLADDDIGDIHFFDNALKELPITTLFTTVNDGEQQMNHLSQKIEYLTVVLFTDLKMLRKNSFEFLSEIGENERFKNIYMIIFSMSYPQDKSYKLGMKSNFFKLGAHVYIRNPGVLIQLKHTVQYALTMSAE